MLQRYVIKNPCGVGWGRFFAQNRIEIASKIACVNGPLVFEIAPKTKTLGNVPMTACFNMLIERLSIKAVTEKTYVFSGGGGGGEGGLRS